MKIFESIEQLISKLNKDKMLITKNDDIIKINDEVFTLNVIIRDIDLVYISEDEDIALSIIHNEDDISIKFENII